ncbi:MAG TPA: nucleotide exchange factor GrpE, partial [Candidatus Altiarchaeales archaeon]|nr:nucleotide exchange factor GrpE [Candidatus Altiarchaeales archaeon]
ESGGLDEPVAGEGVQDSGGGSSGVKDKSGEYLELLQKVQADFENYKKRAERERAEHQRYANQKIVEEFLEVKDNLERALQNKEDAKSMASGVELTLKMLDGLLKKHGVEEINPAGEKFDPNFHEALMFEEGAVEDETVSEVLQKGYLLHSRVVRPAKVRITKPKE